MLRTKIPRRSPAREAPYTFEKRDGHYEVRLHLPFADQGRSRAVQEGRRAGGGDRHAAPAHRAADVDGHFGTGSSAP